MISTVIEAVIDVSKGNNEGKAFLYENTYRKAYYVAYKYMKNEDDALDVVQDAYIKAFDRIDQLDNALQFESWLNKIVASTALDALKKKKPLLFTDISNDDEEYDVAERFEANYSEQPEVVIDKNETSRLVQEIIGELSDEQRVCVTMYYIQEMPVKDISEVLDVSDNTVMRRLHYARKNIEKKVKELEKKGTKLYALAPIPFFVFLLGKEASACEVAAIAGLFSATGAGVATGAGASAGTAGAATGAGASAGTATSAGAAATGMSLGVKVAIGITAAVVAVGGAVGAGVAIYNNSNDSATEVIEEQKQWIDAYIDYINTNFKDDRDGSYFGKFALVYVDDDDIPEIMYLGGDALNGGGFLVYADGEVNDELFMRGEGEYLPGEGLIYGTNGLRWEDWHTVFEIKNGHFNVVAHGGSELNETTKLFDNYTLNDAPATQEEVGKAVAQAFGNGNYRIKNGRIKISNDRSKSSENEQFYTHDEIINILNGKR